MHVDLPQLLSQYGYLAVFIGALLEGESILLLAGYAANSGYLSFALVVAMKRPSTATALDNSSVIRIPRGLFQRVLESDPAAARRLRDEFASRTSQIASDILMAGGKLST